MVANDGYHVCDCSSIVERCPLGKHIRGLNSDVVNTHCLIDIQVLDRLAEQENHHFSLLPLAGSFG